jgi:hypothetical protein
MVKQTERRLTRRERKKLNPANHAEVSIELKADGLCEVNCNQSVRYRASTTADETPTGLIKSKVEIRDRFYET